jgi:hypothetical protein
VSLTIFGSRGRDVCQNLRVVKGALLPVVRDAENFRWTSRGSTRSGWTAGEFSFAEPEENDT